jgi:4-diphosphocytidyl-2-C-methyl-D-erythritol kinase
VPCDASHLVRITKQIPVAGGMAGGSADGAAALLAHDRLHDLRQPDDALLAQAARLGSDVPFSLVGGTARGRGRGEVVEPVGDHGPWWWVVVPAPVGLSTPEVYRHFDRLHPDAPEVPASAEPLLAALATGEPLRLARALHNDLQEPAIDLRPELGDLISRGEAEGALRGLVSGSGPTCVFLCDSQEGSMAVTTALAASYDVVLPALGPVAGAHVVEVV